MNIIKKIISVGSCFLVILMVFTIFRSNSVAAQVCSGTASPTYTKCTCSLLPSGVEECDCLTTPDTGSCYWKDGICQRCARANDNCGIFGSGVCEVSGGGSGLCTTSGCTIVADPEITPIITPDITPSEDPCLVCCGDLASCVGHDPSRDDDCGGNYCCESCAAYTCTAIGSWKFWFFYDRNNNQRFDDGDSRLTPAIYNGMTVYVDTASDKTYGGGDIGATNFTGLGWSEPENCCDANKDCNECEGEGFFGTDQCCDTVSSSYAYRDRITDFQNNFFWGYYDELKLNSFDGAAQIISGDSPGWSPSSNVIFTFTPPPDYQVSVIRYADDQDDKATIENIKTKTNQSAVTVLVPAVNCGADAALNIALFAVGISKNDPPEVDTITIQSPDNDSNTSTESFCSSLGSEPLLVRSIMHTSDNPTNNLLTNGNFETNLEPWNVLNLTTANQESDAAYGSKSIKVSAAGSGDRYATTPFFSPSFWVTSDNRFNLSFSAKADSDTTISGINIQTERSGSWGTKWLDTISVGTDWRRYTFENISIPNSIASNRLRVVLRPTSDGGSAYYDGIRLERSMDTGSYLNVREDENNNGIIDGKYSNIRAVQLNFENEDDSNYSGSLWPLRLSYDHRTGYNDNGINIGHLYYGNPFLDMGGAYGWQCYGDGGASCTSWTCSGDCELDIDKDAGNFEFDPARDGFNPDANRNAYAESDTINIGHAIGGRTYRLTFDASITAPSCKWRNEQTITGIGLKGASSGTFVGMNSTISVDDFICDDYSGDDCIDGSNCNQDWRSYSVNLSFPEGTADTGIKIVLKPGVSQADDYDNYDTTRYEAVYDNISLEELDTPGSAFYTFKVWSGSTNLADMDNSTFNAATGLVAYDQILETWYLKEDITFNDHTILGGGDEGTTHPTYMQEVNNYLLNYWSIIPSSTAFTSDLYNLNAWVEDNDNEQDQTGANLIIDGGVGNADWYFHRMATLDITEPTLDINFVEDEDDAPTGLNTYCGYRLGGTAISLDNPTLDITDSDGFNPQTVPADGDPDLGTLDSIQVDCDTCDTAYDVTLHIPPGSSYACGCRAVSGDPYACFYASVPASYISGEDPINFYLESVDLTNEAWFQTVGGSIQAAGEIVSFVPYNGGDGPCLTIVDCQPSLIAGLPFGSSAITYSPGFPITSNARIDTHDADNNQDNLIHYNPERTFENPPPDEPTIQAADGNAPNVNLSTTQENYNYFYSKFGAEYDDNSLANADMPTDFSTETLEVLFHEGNLTINKDNGWIITNGQKVVIFVDGGNLTITGGTGESGTIIEVEEGGFLAFIVSGNITVDAAVGHDMEGENYTLASFLPTNANASIQGVFIADGTFEIDSNEDADARDRKFIGAGTFVGWTDINLNRNFDDGDLGLALHNVQATETFIHRPDFLLNMPNEMKNATHEWRQVPAAIE